MNYQPRPLREEEQKAFQSGLPSLVGEIAEAKRETGRSRLVLTLFGGVVGLTGILAYAHLLPYLQTRVENHWIKVDQTTGYISPVTGAEDAPKLYDQRTNQTWAKIYTQRRENYAYATDPENFRVTQLLSGSDERTRYVAWHDRDPLAPHQALKKTGSIETDHFVFFPQGKPTSAIGPFSFLITYQRRVTKDGSVGQWEDWQANISFEWHPEMLTDSQSVQDNSGGMVVITYQASKP